jgi:hypothetical protein
VVGLEDWIRDQIATWSPHEPPPLGDAMRAYHFLPLYRGWMATLGIRPDLELVIWYSDEEPQRCERLEHPKLRRLAIAQGIKRYPELRPLRPARPDHATTCTVCNGTGTLVMPTLVCVCGGIGWLIPGEPPPPSIG